MELSSGVVVYFASSLRMSLHVYTHVCTLHVHVYIHVCGYRILYSIRGKFCGSQCALPPPVQDADSKRNPLLVPYCKLDTVAKKSNW